MSTATIRDYTPADFEAIIRIHAENGLPYTLPQINSLDLETQEVKKAPLWIVTKVLEVDGAVRMALGSWIQVELYLWIDKGDWATPEFKHHAIDAIKNSVFKDLWLKGIEHATLWLPPQFKRFGKRLEKDFGFTCTSSEGWLTYSARTGQ